MQPQIQPAAPLKQILYFFVRFRPSESLVQVQKNNLRYSEPQRTGNFPANQFGNQRFRPVSCPSEFDYILKFIVSFGQSR